MTRVKKKLIPHYLHHSYLYYSQFSLADWLALQFGLIMTLSLIAFPHNPHGSPEHLKACVPSFSITNEVDSFGNRLGDIHLRCLFIIPGKVSLFSALGLRLDIVVWMK